MAVANTSSTAPNLVAGPRAYVQVYPHEGGIYAIESGQLLACSTSKYLKQPAGTFEFTLAPGGPNGPNVGPSWLDIITPMSFVMIGMSRGRFKQIVMLGVVTQTNESWIFPTAPNQPVRRTMSIRGMDIGYFFVHFSWYALTYINSTAALLGAAVGNDAAGASLGTEAGLGGYLTAGPPDQLGAAWYSKLMDGKQGVLSKSWLQYGKDNSVLFSDAVTVQFEKYLDSLTVPFSFSFIPEETWYQKFNKIFPFPWYEFFVMTAPSGFYDKALSTTWNNVSSGTKFSMTGLGPDVTAQIYIIARVNPLPSLTAEGTSDSIKFGSLIMNAWNSLITFPEDTGLIATNEQFSEDEVRNFYIVNPTFMRSMLGQANDAVIPPVLNGAVAVDPASIHRYGFRPIYMETEWFADQAGNTAQTGKLDFNKAYGNLIGKLAAQYEPVSLMMRADRTGPLRPDIVPGNKFTYRPLKDKVQAPWTFYIEGVEHSYIFGGPSRTKISLSRGLPSDIYADSSDGGVLQALHLGTAQRLNGEYKLGLPSSSFETESGLEGVSILSANMRKVLNDIAPIYGTAQSDQLNPPT
jgi:hypothetical protein